MAVDPNHLGEFDLNPIEFMSVAKFHQSPPEEVIDDLIAIEEVFDGPQVVITRFGRPIAVVEPIAQDDATQKSWLELLLGDKPDSPAEDTDA